MFEEHVTKAVEDGEYGNSQNHSTIIEVTFLSYSATYKFKLLK